MKNKRQCVPIAAFAGILFTFFSSCGNNSLVGGKAQHPSPQPNLAPQGPPSSSGEIIKKKVELTDELINTIPDFSNAEAKAAFQDALREIQKDATKVNTEIDLPDGAWLPLGAAARFCTDATSSQILQKLIDMGATVDQISSDKYTALGYAVRETNLEAAKILLANGADINKGHNDEPAWELALGSFYDLDILGVLFEDAKNVRAADKFCSSDEQYFLGLLHFLWRRLLPHSDEKLGLLQDLISKGADVNRLNARDYTVWEVALLENRIDYAIPLIKCMTADQARMQIGNSARTPVERARAFSLRYYYDQIVNAFCTIDGTLREEFELD